MAELQIDNLVAGYDRADVLCGVSLTARAGAITCLLGSNGAGKTTLIRAVLGLTPPRSGRVQFRGQELTSLPTHEIVSLGIACIPEGRKVFPKMSVPENLLVGAYGEQNPAAIEARMGQVWDIFPRLRERAGQNAISPAVERKGFAFGFIDSGLKPGAEYKYRVAVSDTKGERVLFKTEAISVPAPPLTLSQNFPNPFNPMTAIQYSLPEKCRVALSLYDVSGKLIARLVDTEQDAGIHRAEWNGRDAHGKQAASGVYFYRLTAGKSTLSRKMVLLL